MAKKPKVAKTNAMRELDAAGVAYEVRTYDVEATGHQFGVAVANALGQNPDATFKTLVMRAPDGTVVVCCVPVSQEVDLKKVAEAAGLKRLEMLPTKELEAVSGYVRGACTPVGMRKRFLTIIDETALLEDTIALSGGRRGVQLLLSPEALIAFVDARIADVTKDGA